MTTETKEALIDAVNLINHLGGNPEMQKRALDNLIASKSPQDKVAPGMRELLIDRAATLGPDVIIDELLLRALTAEKKLYGARSIVERFQEAAGLVDSSGDAGTITPAHVGNELQKLRNCLIYVDMSLRGAMHWAGSMWGDVDCVKHAVQGAVEKITGRPLPDDVTADPPQQRPEYGKWTWSYDDTHWPARYGYNTKEEAIAAAREGDEHFDGTIFFVGQMGEPKIPTVDTDWLLGHIDETMHESEFGGEWAEGWLDGVKKGKKEFEAIIDTAFIGLLERNNALPGWFIVLGAEEHKL